MKGTTSNIDGSRDSPCRSSGSGGFVGGRSVAFSISSKEEVIRWTWPAADAQVILRMARTTLMSGTTPVTWVGCVMEVLDEPTCGGKLHVFVNIENIYSTGWMIIPLGIPGTNLIPLTLATFHYRLVLVVGE